MKILLIDNYDSFTFNLYHYLSSLKVKVDVIRNDKITDKKTLSKELEITAQTDDGIIMGVKHKKYNIHGVQFHPESIKTIIGIKILKNFINYKH